MATTSSNHASIEPALDTTALSPLPESPLPEPFTVTPLADVSDVQSGMSTTKLAIKQVCTTENQAIT